MISEAASIHRRETNLRPNQDPINQSVETSYCEFNHFIWDIFFKSKIHINFKKWQNRGSIVFKPALLCTSKKKGRMAGQFKGLSQTPSP
jgi:hypothetical protein